MKKVVFLIDQIFNTEFGIMILCPSRLILRLIPGIGLVPSQLYLPNMIKLGFLADLKII